MTPDSRKICRASTAWHTWAGVVCVLASSAVQATSARSGDWESTVLLRSFYDRLSPASGLPRFGAIQAAQWTVLANHRAETLAVGVDASVFAAVKLDGSSNAGNRTLVASDGTTSRRDAWAYPAKLALSVAVDGAQVKAGFQTVNNPFLQPDETRALPPTFRGVVATVQGPNGSKWEAGSFDRTIPRGHVGSQPLTTSFGGTRVKRFDYVGGRWESPVLSQTLYIGRALDVWVQAFSSTSVQIGESALGTSRARFNVYFTQESGRRLQGDIDVAAASFALSTGTSAATVTLGLQKIFGHHYFDYLAETNGIFLANVYGGDYNAPQEQSVQLKLRMNGAAIGLEGLDLGTWVTRGWGADASVEAAKHVIPGVGRHQLYWRNGRSAGGSNRESGLRLSYRFLSGRLRGSQLWLMTMAHRQSPDYPSSAYNKTQLVLQVPIKLAQGSL